MRIQLQKRDLAKIYTVLEIKAFVMCGDGDFQCSDGDTNNRSA